MPTEIEERDVVIVGAGPAGFACAYFLMDSGLNVALLDKAVFPRDKVCGDALSADVVKQLKNFFPDIFQAFLDSNSKTASYGISFFSPDQQRIDIPFTQKVDYAPGYIKKRIHFDDFLLNQLKSRKPQNIDILEGFKIETIDEEDDGILVSSKRKLLRCKMIIGADGANSRVKRQFQGQKLEKNHHCAGIRAYVKGVTDFNDKNFIELHFIKKTLPGYFWIFPLPDGFANVGLGILAEEVSRKKINIVKMFHDIIENEPYIAERFKNAEIVGDIKGLGLPIGSKKRSISGKNFLLTGDAASLIDPFSGEGIGNALRSGRYAAMHIKQCFANNDFSADFNKKYDRFVYQKMWNELRVSRQMQKLLKYPSLFNFVVRKARKNDAIKQLLINMLDDTDMKNKLLSPRFYVRLLFNF